MADGAKHESLDDDALGMPYFRANEQPPYGYSTCPRCGASVEDTVEARVAHWTAAREAEVGGVARERIDALAAEYAAVIAIVAPRADALDAARGYPTPRNLADVEWWIEDGTFYGHWTGHWTDSSCGQTERYTLDLSFEAAAMSDDDFEAHVALVAATEQARIAEQARKVRAAQEEAERAQLARLTAKYAPPVPDEFQIRHFDEVPRG